jgi:hypothetical protein
MNGHGGDRMETPGALCDLCGFFPCGCHGRAMDAYSASVVHQLVFCYICLNTTYSLICDCNSDAAERAEAFDVGLKNDPCWSHSVLPESRRAAGPAREQACASGRV